MDFNDSFGPTNNKDEEEEKKDNNISFEGNQNNNISFEGNNNNLSFDDIDILHYFHLLFGIYHSRSKAGIQCFLFYRHGPFILLMIISPIIANKH